MKKVAVASIKCVPFYNEVTPIYNVVHFSAPTDRSGLTIDELRRATVDYDNANSILTEEQLKNGSLEWVYDYKASDHEVAVHVLMYIEGNADQGGEQLMYAFTYLDDY